MPRRKAPSERLNRETRDLGLVRRTSGAVPECPKVAGKVMKPRVREWWDTYWASDVAGAALDADLPALIRLFELYDQRERLLVVYLSEPFTTGSTGQLSMHPAAREIASLDGRIERLEVAFGITPDGRLKLGIQMGAAARSLDDLNRAFSNPADVDEVDPRLRVIEGSASDGVA